MSRTIRLAFTFAASLTVLFAACTSGPSSGTSGNSRGEAAAAEREIERIESLMAERGRAARVVDALTAALPERVWLTEIAYDGGMARVKGRAPSNNALAGYLERLGASPRLANVSLASSDLKIAAGREVLEFALDIAAPEGSFEPSATPGADPEVRLRELERSLPARQGSSETLREIQRLALEAGLQMTKFSPGPEAAGVSLTELPVTIEVSGGLGAVARCLDGMSELSRPWAVARLSLKAVKADDPRSQVRASILARTWFRS